MRVWDIDAKYLCNKHLVASNHEIHVMWNTLLGKSRAWSNHPETKRWRGKMMSLYNKHEEIADEMVRRGFNHKSPLNISTVPTSLLGNGIQDKLWQSIDDQIKNLKNKQCKCKV